MKRRWLLWLLLAIIAVIVFSRLGELRTLAQTLRQGLWPWVLAAAALQVVYYVVLTGVYQSAFDTVGVASRLPELLPVVLGSIFVNVAAPSAGMSGNALFVDDAARRGQSPARATAGVFLELVADLGSFSLVLLAGMGFLYAYHDLQVYEIVASAALVAIILALVGVLALGLARPEALRRLLGWVQGRLVRVAALLHRAPFLPEGWAAHSAAEFSAAAAAIAGHRAKLLRTLMLGLAAHLLDLLTVYALFLAFRAPVTLAVLVGGYAIGILFWFISITPQGIGVVEGVMALVYTSLGVSLAQATVVTLAFRGLTFWLPLLLGSFVLQKVRSFGAPARSQARAWNVQLLALLTALMGMINVLTVLAPRLARRLEFLSQFSPLEVRRGGHLTTVLAGFALLVLARSLWRRKWMAWLLTMVVLGISVVSLLLRGLYLGPALLAAGLAAWLFTQRHQFHARSDPPSIWQGVRALGAAFAFTMAYGMAGFYVLDRHFGLHLSLRAAFEQTVVMFTQFYDPGLQPLTSHGRFFADSIYVVGAGTLAYALFMLLRPVLERRPANVEERARAAAIVERYGHSSLARMALLPDKSFHFTPGGSVVAYVAKGGVGLALGDPIGPPADARAALANFMEMCARNDWRAAFYQTLPENLALYREAGLSTLEIGQEAIVDLATYTLAGNANKHLRAAVNRLGKAGYRAELCEPPLADDLMRELRAVSDEWLTLVVGTEKRFSLGWFDDDYIRNAPVMAVRGPDGRISAFANIVPEYQASEATIDLMRHRHEMVNGTMEFLFDALFEWARAKGFATFNLGLSALAGRAERGEGPAMERGLQSIYAHANQFYGYEGLSYFKLKFHPNWSPRYLIYPGPASLPAIALAIIRADSGDGFLADYLPVLLARRPRESGEDVATSE